MNAYTAIHAYFPVDTDPPHFLVVIESRAFKAIKAEVAFRAIVRYGNCLLFRDGHANVVNGIKPFAFWTTFTFCCARSECATSLATLQFRHDECT